MAAVTESSATNERLDQWFRWPGVFPRSRQYAPRAMFSPRHSGSRGTDTSRCFVASRAISACVFSLVPMLTVALVLLDPETVPGLIALTGDREGPVIRHLFDLAGRGVPDGVLARHLNAEGYRTRSGRTCRPG